MGIFSGYFGGKTDIALMRTTDYFLVIPDVPLMIVAAAVFGRSLTNIVIIIGVIYWASTARLIRAQVITVRERVYVKRARSLGARNWRIIQTHILPQVMPLLVANTVLMVAAAVFAETYIWRSSAWATRRPSHGARRSRTRSRATPCSTMRGGPSSRRASA